MKEIRSQLNDMEDLVADFADRIKIIRKALNGIPRESSTIIRIDDHDIKNNDRQPELTERFEHSPFLVATADRRGLMLQKGTVIKLGSDKGNRYYNYTDKNYSIIDVETALSKALKPGADYYLWLMPNLDRGAYIEIALASDDPKQGRLIGGFHTLCNDVGDIDGHPLSGYKAGDILPQSVWCLNHRSAGLQNGTVYDPIADQWVMIYLCSGTGKNTRSECGEKPTVNRNWYQFVDDALKVRGKLFTRAGFISAMDGSPNCTSIDEYPDKTGGHTAENGQRVISNIGCEDGTGVLWQWCEDAGQIDHGDSKNWDWKKTDKGSVFGLGGGRDPRCLAGGGSGDGSSAGLVAWYSDSGASYSYATVGARFCFSALHFAE